MAIWTNDRYVANPHRVVNPPDVDRYSHAAVRDTPFHARIECLETCLAPASRRATSRWWLGRTCCSRFDNTHSYRNEFLDAHNRAVAAAYR